MCYNHLYFFYIGLPCSIHRISMFYVDFLCSWRLFLLYVDFPCSMQTFLTLRRLFLLYADFSCSIQTALVLLRFAYFPWSTHSFLSQPSLYSLCILALVHIDFLALSGLSLCWAGFPCSICTDSLCSTPIFLALHTLSLLYPNFSCFIEIIFDLCQFSLFCVDFLYSTQTFLALCRLFLIYIDFPCYM